MDLDSKLIYEVYNKPGRGKDYEQSKQYIKTQLKFNIGDNVLIQDPRFRIRFKGRMGIIDDIDCNTVIGGEVIYHVAAGLNRDEDTEMWFTHRELKKIDIEDKEDIKKVQDLSNI